MDPVKKTSQQVDLSSIDVSKFDHRYVGCVVLTKDNQILLQQRGDHWERYPGYLAEFGGCIEANETAIHALIRELNEELGAQVNADDVISFGAIVEKVNHHHQELIYIYFWHDKRGTITGCYEGIAKYFNNLNDVLKHPKIMDSVRWLLYKCQEEKLIK